MTITYGIKVGGISSDGESAEYTYLVRGTTDGQTARQTILSNAPASVVTAEGDTLTLNTDGVRAQATDNDDDWEVSAPYTYEEFGQQVTSSFSFDVGSNQQHIFTAINQSKYGATAPDVGNSINVTKKGIEGVDINIPVYTAAERHIVSSSFVTTAYKATLLKLVGSMNASNFKGLNAGEGLLVGASGSSRDDGRWELEYRWAGAPNKTNIDVGNGITVSSKRGWDYLWLMYEDQQDDSYRIVPKPIGAYVSQVYPLENWAALGIGT